MNERFVAAVTLTGLNWPEGDVFPAAGVGRLTDVWLNAVKKRPNAYVHVAEGAKDVAFVSRYVLREETQTSG